MNNVPEHSRVYRLTYLFFAIFLIFSGLSISISQAALAFSLLIWIYGLYKKYDDIKYYRSGMESYILAFVAVSFILAFLSPSILKNLLYIRDFWLISIFILTSSLIKTRDDISRIAKILIFIALFNSLIGIVQYITDIDFLNAVKYGMSHKRSHLSFGERHVVGFLGHHLTYGGYIMMITIPFLYISFLKRGETKGIPVSLIRLSAVLLFISVILSWARSAIISLPVAVLPVFFKKKKTFLAVLLIIILAVIVILSGFGPNKNIVKNLYNHSSKVRILIWKNALRVWLKSPIIGVGGGNYIEEFKRVIGEHPDDDPKMITHAHSDYLNQLARKGVVGFLAFIYMLFGILKFMINNMKYIEDRFSRYLYWGLFGAFCCFLSASMYQCYYTDEENLAIFWFVIGLLTAIVKIEKDE